MATKLEAPPPLHANQGAANHSAPNWVLQQSAKFAKEYRQMHGKPPIGQTKEYDTEEYIYIVKYYKNKKGEVDRTIKRKWKGSYLLLILRKLWRAIKFIGGGVASLVSSISTPSRSDSSRESSSLIGNRAHCPNCDRQRRRYDSDRFLRCHRCGWVIGWPVVRWVRYPTWIQHSWYRLKNREGSRLLSTVMNIPFYPLRMIDPNWWRVLPYKRQHTLLLGILIGVGAGYVLASISGLDFVGFVKSVVYNLLRAV